MFILFAALLACGGSGCDSCDDSQACPGWQLPWHRDGDGDGYADNATVCSFLSPGAGYSLFCRLAGPAIDCDDADPGVNPGTQEFCDDGKDNDCDGITDSCSEPPVSIWRPSPGTSWQWQLTGTIDTPYDVTMYDIDLFENTASRIRQLHDAGCIVICYFSAGSWENWRPDAGAYPASVRGAMLQGWSDEKWLDIRQLDILGPLIQARLDLAVSKGCDGVEPDNVDGYANYSGFPLTAADQLAFNTWLAREAHARNLSVGLKNDLDQVPGLVDHFDWALNEQCFEYNECDRLVPFVQGGKAVFGVEYNLETSEFCSRANALNFDWLKKNLELDAPREACR